MLIKQTHSNKKKLTIKTLTPRMEPKAKQILNPMVHQVVTNYCRVNKKADITPTVIIYIISLVLITYYLIISP